MREIVIWLSLATPICTVPAGCDPGGPGAAGTISLDPAVDPTEFVTLQIRAFPDAEAGFDAADGVPQAGELYASSYDLSEIEFPYDYMIGGGVGTTEHRRWRVLAWLSATEPVDALPEGPASGEFFGTTLFMVDACGGTFDGYCDLTTGVDFTIDTVLP
jgi:hypothetical protein